MGALLAAGWLLLLAAALLLRCWLLGPGWVYYAGLATTREDFIAGFPQARSAAQLYRTWGKRS